MKKTALATAITMSLGIGMVNATDMNSATFSMWSPYGNQVNPAGNDTTVAGAIGGGTWSVSSTKKFFGAIWTAHNGTTFGPGTYTINTIEAGSYTGVVVGSGQIGGHILFDWNGTYNIDVINVWDVTNVSGTANYTSTIVTSSAANCDLGKPGAAMIDGPFGGNCANFDFITPAGPSAANDTASTTTDTLVNINLVANDSAAKIGDTASSKPAEVPPATITLPGGSSTTQGGTAVNKNDGTVDYTPPGGYNGPDSFQYTLTDEAGNVSSPATVSITVSTTANIPPVANNADFSTLEDTSLAININDDDDNGDPIATDGDGDPLTFANYDAVTAQKGTVVANAADTTLTYTPAVNFNGIDTFNYTVTDTKNDSNSATMTITVAPDNDALACKDVSLFTPLDVELPIDIDDTLLSTCTDPDGDTLSLDSFTQPTVSGSSVSSDGISLTYTPANGFTGNDSFTYTATDGTVNDTPRTVTITIADKIYGNFTMLASDGKTFGGTNDVVSSWDGSLNTDENSTNFNMTIASDQPFPFFGFPWFAHHIRVFGPGIYMIDTTCTTSQLDAGTNPCGGTPSEIYTLTVPTGQIGAHILFDWNISKNIDVLQNWDQDGVFMNPVAGGELYQGQAGTIPALDAVFELVSRDADGDGVPGARMIDGPFIGLRPNFNLNFTKSSGGGGSVTAPKSSISSADAGGGCTISSGHAVSTHTEWWLIAGFMVGLGVVTRRKASNSSGK